MLEVILKWMAVTFFGAAIMQGAHQADKIDKIEMPAPFEVPMSERVKAACGPKATIDKECMRKLNPGDPLWKQ